MDVAVVDVVVDRDADGALVVTWELGPGVRHAVEVATGDTPVPTEHVHLVTVAAGEHSARVGRDRLVRTYVSVGVEGGRRTVAAERRVTVEGVRNFRDLGGYRGADGRRVRWGRLYRADALTFTPTGRAAYERLGVRAVYDLRAIDERTVQPDPVISTHIPVLGHVETAGAMPAWTDAVDHAGGERFMRAVYGGLLEHAGPAFATLLGRFADGANLPAVFHCTGGKDRTGLAAALVLEALGVARTDVLDDYELTSRSRLADHRPGAYEALIDAGMGPEAAAAVFGTPRWTMAEALAELDERYGGADGYLTGPAGLGRDTLAALRAELLS